VLVWGPLDGGLLTGKYLDEDGRADEGRLRTLDREITDRQHAVAREVVAVADELDVSPARVTLAWVRQQPGQLIPIVGATKSGQLADNLASLGLTLGDAHLARLDDVSAVEMGFPHDFLADETIENVIFGGTKGLIDPYGE
jgi:aryl-alcohol dehydrogenase-like predicted oxidoreductase